MFRRKSCDSCGKKFKGDYDFCPYCGDSLESNEKEEDFGLLGKDDSGFPKEEFKIPGGFNILFNSLFKNLEKQLREVDRNFEKELDESKKSEKDFKYPKMRKQGISINISVKGNNPPKIDFTSYGNKGDQTNRINDKRKKVREVFSNSFSENKLKKIRNLPREEPKTNIKRFSNGVVYEIEMPGVKSVSDISIINLENSIEVKAISDNKVYSKTIQMNDILDYKFQDGKLFLEFRNK